MYKNNYYKSNNLISYLFINFLKKYIKIYIYLIFFFFFFFFFFLLLFIDHNEIFKIDIYKFICNYYYYIKKLKIYFKIGM